MADEDKKAAPQPEQQTLDPTLPHSINEPPGSDVLPDVPPPPPPPEGTTLTDHTSKEVSPSPPPAQQTQHRGTQTQTLPHHRTAPPRTPSPPPSRR